MCETSHQWERSFTVAGGDFTSAGEAASKIKKLLGQLGLAADHIHRIAVASYEAELNIVIHAFAGEIIVAFDPDLITVIARDRGPGISDIELAMQEGYSTAPEVARQMGFGAGMGLPNMRRCSDQIQVQSEVGKGTNVIMKFHLRQKATL